MAVREMPSKDSTVDCREECLTWNERELVLHNQYVSKLSRIDLENRFLRVYEENIQLKTECNRMRDQMKRLGTRVYRLIASQKNHSGCSIGGFERQALGAELLLSEQAQRIAVLEAENSRWRAKVEAMRQQFLAPSNFMICRRVKKKKCVGGHHEQCQLEEEIERLKDTLQRMERTINILRDGGCDMDDISTTSSKKGKGKCKSDDIQESSSEEKKECSEQPGPQTEVEEQRVRVASDVELIKARRQLATLTEELTSLKEHATEIEQELAKKEEALEAKIRDYEVVNEQVKKNIERIAELQQEIIDLHQYEHRVKDLTEQLNYLKSERDDIKAQNSQLLQLSTVAIGSSRSASKEESKHAAGEHLAILQQRITTLETALLTEKAERLSVETSKEEDRLKMTQLLQQNEEMTANQKKLEERFQIEKTSSVNAEVHQKEAEELRALNKELELKCQTLYSQKRELEDKKNTTLEDKKNTALEDKKNTTLEDKKNTTLGDKNTTLEDKQTTTLEDKQKEKEEPCSRCLQLEKELESLKSQETKILDEEINPDILDEEENAMLDVLKKFQQFRERGYYSTPVYPFSDRGDVPVSRYPTLEETRIALGLRKSNSNSSVIRNENDSATTPRSEEGQGDHHRTSSSHVQVGQDDAVSGESTSGTAVPLSVSQFLEMTNPERLSSASSVDFHCENISKPHLQQNHDTVAARTARLENEIKYLEAAQELEKCQELLRVQQNINKLYRSEVNGTHGMVSYDALQISQINAQKEKLSVSLDLRNRLKSSC